MTAQAFRMVFRQLIREIIFGAAEDRQVEARQVIMRAPPDPDASRCVSISKQFLPFLLLGRLPPRLPPQTGFFLAALTSPHYTLIKMLTGHLQGCCFRVRVSIDMGLVPASPAPPTLKHLEARVRSLDTENQLLRSRLEEQNQRMAQMLEENDSLKTQLSSAGMSDPDQPKGSRRGSGVLSNEEMDFALSMARNSANPASR